MGIGKRTMIIPRGRRCVNQHRGPMPWLHQ